MKSKLLLTTLATLIATSSLAMNKLNAIEELRSKEVLPTYLIGLKNKKGKIISLYGEKTKANGDTLKFCKAVQPGEIINIDDVVFATVRWSETVIGKKNKNRIEKNIFNLKKENNYFVVEK